MANPTYRCPWKQNAGIGITCENVDCGGYNFRKEDCNLIMAARKSVRMSGAPARDSIVDGVTDYSSSSSSYSSSSSSSSSISSSSSSSSKSTSSSSSSSSSSSTK